MGVFIIIVMHFLYENVQFNVVSRLVIGYGHFYSSVPDGFVLVLLSCINRPIFLIAINNLDKALREFWEWLTSEFCFDDCQFKEA